jgi:conjugative transfer signal peptidase TraF
MGGVRARRPLEALAKRRLGTAAMLGLGLLASPRTSLPILLWNASPSVRVGLYRVVVRTPAAGELAVIRLPDPIRALALERGYLAGRALVIKPVTAGPGDVVCRHAAMVTVNGHPVAWAHRADGAGRALPRWNGCLTLTASQVFVLSPAPGSIDSRYFGPVERVHVLGVGWPIWAT